MKIAAAADRLNDRREVVVPVVVPCCLRTAIDADKCSCRSEETIPDELCDFRMGASLASAEFHVKEPLLSAWQACLRGDAIELGPAFVAFAMLGSAVAAFECSLPNMRASKQKPASDAPESDRPDPILTFETCRSVHQAASAVGGLACFRPLAHLFRHRSSRFAPISNESLPPCLPVLRSETVDCAAPIARAMST